MIVWYYIARSSLDRESILCGDVLCFDVRLDNDGNDNGTSVVVVVVVSDDVLPCRCV
jgi:hypothetical protein